MRVLSNYIVKMMLCEKLYKHISDLCALAETCKRQGIMPENLTRYSLNMELAYKNMRYIINEAIEKSMESHLPFQYDLGGDGII